MLSLATLLFSVSFVAFPSKEDAIFAKYNSSVVIQSSGSIGLYKNGKCVKTHPNETLIPSEDYEWCSNIAKDKTNVNDNPWIQYSLNGKQMKLTSYAVRNGCCRYACCCDEDGKIIDGYCCCYLYSYSLQASNDNKTWKVLHKVEKDNKFYACQTKTFELKQQSMPYSFFRFVLDEEWPGCVKCMQVNQIELYGDVIDSGNSYYHDGNDDDESVSIIGRVKKDEQ